MDIVIKLLIALHIFGLVMGMGSGLALSVVGPNFASSDPAERGILFKISDVLRRNGHIGLGILWVTGILVLFLKYGDVSIMSWVFWLKIALALILSASIGMGSAAYKRFASGDAAAGARMALMGKVSGATALTIIVVAMFAFS